MLMVDDSYTEKDWNMDSVKQVEEEGVDAEGGDSYRASKTLAEKALWTGSSSFEG